jgi:hypothetical protein
MPLIKKRVEGCSYNPEAHVAAFNLRNMPVIIEAKKIIIYNPPDLAEAQGVIDWLANVTKASD